MLKMESKDREVKTGFAWKWIHCVCVFCTDLPFTQALITAHETNLSEIAFREATAFHRV